MTVPNAESESGQLNRTQGGQGSRIPACMPRTTLRGGYTPWPYFAQLPYRASLTTFNTIFVEKKYFMPIFWLSWKLPITFL